MKEDHGALWCAVQYLPTDVSWFLVYHTSPQTWFHVVSFWPRKGPLIQAREAAFSTGVENNAAVGKAFSPVL